MVAHVPAVFEIPDSNGHPVLPNPQKPILLELPSDVAGHVHSLYNSGNQHDQV